MMKHMQTQVNHVTTTTNHYQDIHNSIQQLPTVTTSQLQQCEANINFDVEKKNIYCHPLFPLVAALFDRSEQATHGLDGTAQQSAVESFQADLTNFLQRLDQERKMVYTENRELDQLMVQTIQVLCIHLRELEKVNELCKDFCTRYITCLKQKYLADVASELESPDASLSGGAPDDALSDVGFPPAHPAQAHLAGRSAPKQTDSQPNTASASPNASAFRPVADYQSAYPPYSVTGAHFGPNSNRHGSSHYYTSPCVANANAQPRAVPQFAALQFGSGQQGAGSNGGQRSMPVDYAAGFILASPAASTSNGAAANANAAPRSTSVEADTTARAQKRGVLPKQATQVMKSWLFQHLVHPYPTEDEKRQMAAQTNLSLLQVNNWFINARRRVLQPMLDAANPDHTKRKKSSNARPACQRFWPANLAQLPANSSAARSDDAERLCASRSGAEDDDDGDSDFDSPPAPHSHSDSNDPSAASFGQPPLADVKHAFA